MVCHELHVQVQLKIQCALKFSLLFVCCIVIFFCYLLYMYSSTILTSKLKKLKFRRECRDCIKRNGDKTWMYTVHAIIVTSCHENNDEAWSTSCLVMQHKPYIVELSFMETQKSHDSINEGPSLTTEGPPQTNVVHVPMSHLLRDRI